MYAYSTQLKATGQSLEVAVLYIYMYPLLAVFKMSAQSIQVLYAYEFTCIWRRRHNSWVTHNCLSHNRRMSIVQTSREDKEKGLWRQQISLSCAKEVSAPLMGKLLMWPFEKVLWWCCRAKDIPRDRHGETFPATIANVLQESA